jgi:hypothetical protein
VEVNVRVDHHQHEIVDFLELRKLPQADLDIMNYRRELGKGRCIEIGKGTRI